MKPPRPSEASYVQFAMEIEEIHKVLEERTETAYETFNSIPGYSYNQIDVSLI